MDPDDALEDVLVQSAFQVMAVLSRIGAVHDLSLTQLRVLGILRDRRPRMSDLAGHLGLDKSTMSGLVDRAERRGLVARGRAPGDRRVVDVSITPSGMALAEQVLAEIHAALVPATGRLDAAERRQLTDLLEPVVRAGEFDAVDDSSAPV